PSQWHAPASPEALTILRKLGACLRLASLARGLRRPGSARARFLRSMSPRPRLRACALRLSRASSRGSGRTDLAVRLGLRLEHQPVAAPLLGIPHGSGGAFGQLFRTAEVVIL